MVALVDQIELRRPSQPLALGDLNTIASLDDVGVRLAAADLPYQRTLTLVDTANAGADVVARLVGMAPNAVFEISTDAVIREAQILMIRNVPFGGALAREYAANVLKNQQGRAAVGKATEELRKASAGKIKYSAGFSPPR